MKRVRVMVEFEELNNKGEMVDRKKFGAIVTEHFGPVPRMIEKVTETVQNTLQQNLPSFMGVCTCDYEWERAIADAEFTASLTRKDPNCPLHGVV